MDKPLLAFIQTLRDAEIPVSHRETMDALQTVQMVGLEDRFRFKQALALVLSKTEEEKLRFDACFEHFFSEKRLHGEFLEALALSEKEKRDLSVLITPYTLQKPSTPFSTNSILGRMLLSGDRRGLKHAIQRAEKVVNLKSIHSPLERSSYVRLIIEHLGIDDLDRECNYILGKGQTGNWEAQQLSKRLESRRAHLMDQVNEHVDRQLLRNRQYMDMPLSEDFLKAIKLTSLEHWLYRDIERIVKKMAEHLSTLHSRRKKTGNVGRLDMSKTLRHNLKYGGMLYDLHWKKTRVERPKIFALCDVSHSIGSMSRFFLMFLYCMHDVLPHLRTFAFSTYLEEVSALFDEVSLNEAFPEILRKHSMGLTDYGKVLQEFHQLCLEEIDGKTIVFILGDGRNSGKDPRARLLKAIKKRCKQLIWLNPEPRSRWETTDSEMLGFLPHCHHVASCNSLQDLEALFQQILRRSF